MKITFVSKDDQCIAARDIKVGQVFLACSPSMRGCEPSLYIKVKRHAEEAFIMPFGLEPGDDGYEGTYSGVSLAFWTSYQPLKPIISA